MSQRFVRVVELFIIDHLFELTEVFDDQICALFCMLIFGFLGDLEVKLIAHFGHVKVYVAPFCVVLFRG